MDQASQRKKSFSRRTFLKGLPIGIIGAAAISIVGSRMMASALNRRPPLSKKGSIFSPKDV
ncbi:MAG: twin-arginine translocation signal domain-containing protein [SAR202 cluster bacterium]|nr:twin-arginine translocation signal domain-containing protein [SAR202 cluster bacterium]